MSLELLEQNIAKENELVSSLIDAFNEIESLEYLAMSGNSIDLKRKELLEFSIDLMGSQLNIINQAIPDLLNNISFFKNLKTEEKPTPNLLSVKYTASPNVSTNVAIKKEDEKKFLEKISAQQSVTKKINQTPSNMENINAYIKISNKFFGNYSKKLTSDGSFSSIKIDLRKITSPFLPSSYVAMMFFSTMLSFIVGLFLSPVLFFMELGLEICMMAALGLPIIVFFMFYLYPSSKKKSLEKEINQELPFVTIYMSAIATSGIEPSKIFDVLVASKDYPFIQREIKKLTNLINFYGYDLVSALKFLSKSGPSERLAQLMDGLANTITSGGELTEFLNKHSETLLFDYRLEREKYTQLAETFMNIYISIVIAAPMIMMMLFILMSVANFGLNLGPALIGMLTIAIIVVLNFGFLLFLNMKQPKF